MIAVVALVGCGEKEGESPKDTNTATPAQTEDTKTCYWCKETIKMNALVCKHCQSKRVDGPLIKDPIVEKAVRKELEKPEGELTEADLAKVTELNLPDQITDAGLKDAAKLQTLSELLRGLCHREVVGKAIGDVAH